MNLHTKMDLTYIMTYKEIVAFTEGKQLDEIEKAQEKGKRPYRIFQLTTYHAFGIALNMAHQIQSLAFIFRVSKDFQYHRMIT